MKKVSQYYKQQQYNVMHTAIDNIIKRFNVSIKGGEHLGEFVVNGNLTSDLMRAIDELGYKITKKPKC